MNTYTSTLYDDRTFYRAFLRDLERCQKEVIIESPFITTERMKMLWPTLRKLQDKGVKIFVMTRDPKEHTKEYAAQSEHEIREMEVVGIKPLLCTGNHHRKLAILDRSILWEGSLNILSQIYSVEIMHRFEGGSFAQDMFEFLRLGRYI
jgi:hypothetical protein